MEGCCLRHFPRTMFNHPVELHLADRMIRIEKAAGDLSPGGVFVRGEDLPLDTSLLVRIEAVRPFEVQGVIRRREASGLGIEFTCFHDGNRERLDDFLAELAQGGAPAF